MNVRLNPTLKLASALDFEPDPPEPELELAVLDGTATVVT